MPRTARLAVGGPAGETTDFDADHKFSQLERMLLTAAVCTEMPAPPTGRALLLGGVPLIFTPLKDFACGVEGQSKLSSQGVAVTGGRP